MLPLIGSLLLSVGVKLGVDLISKAWKGPSSDPAGADSATRGVRESFGEILKNRTAAGGTVAPDAAAVPSAAPSALFSTAPRLGLQDDPPAATPAGDAIASYLRNVPQAG